MIITFEGGEGTGKTTNAARLCSFLTMKGLPWLSFREPGGTSLSERIRTLFLDQGMDAMTELMLVLASRRQNIKDIIEPGLAAGRVIVIDRFVDSTMVYQGVLGGLGSRTVRSIMEMSGTWIEPDLTFVLDVSPELALARIEPSDRFELQDIGYHRRLREAFLAMATESRHRIVDTNRDRALVQAHIQSECGAILHLAG